MSKRFDYDLAVIGSGDAGGKAALIAAKCAFWRTLSCLSNLQEGR